MPIQPGRGHAYPMVPAARALQQAGHEIAFVTSERFAPVMRDLGFPAIAGGMDYLESEVRTGFPEARRLKQHQLGAWFLSGLFADLAVHAMVPDLLALVDEHRPDLLLRNDYEYATCIVSERAGIPHATLGCTFAIPPHQIAPLIEEPLAFARSAFGLAPWPVMEMLDPHLYLSQAPLAWQEHTPAVARAVRPDAVVTDDDDPLTDFAGFDPDLPLVYVSMGTVNNTVDGLFPTLLEALADQPINLLITVGPMLDPASWPAQPPNVHIAEFIPQDLVLPRSDLFITNASFFTVVAAIRHGVPVLMCPLSGDEPAGARRYSQLGFGKVLRQPGPPEPPLDAAVPVFGVDTLREGVCDLLEAPEYRQRAGRGAEELATLPPWSEACGWLENIGGAAA